MFLHVSVIHSVHRGEEYLTRYTPRPGTYTPWTRPTPPYGPGAGPGTPPPPEQTPPGPGTPPPLEQTSPRPGTPPPEAEHAGRYGQRAGGPHPTGMQSCLFWSSQILKLELYQIRNFLNFIFCKILFWSSQIYEQKPTVIKNFGVWLRYDSRSGTHNMYREYRDLTTGGAVTQCCKYISSLVQER